MSRGMMFRSYMLLFTCFVYIFSCHRSAAQIFPYAPIFNCLDSAGLYYVSYAANINVTSALTACANGGFQHVPQSSTTGSCFQRYYAHLVAAGNANITLWIQGSSGLTCYPQSAPCPTLSSFICGKTDIAAAPGGSTPCPAPPSIDNAMVIAPSGRQFPSDVLYKCNPGYSIVGSNTAQCQKDGMWHNPAKHCQQEVCNTPYIANGFTAGTAPMFNISCCTGYKLVGQNTVSCTSNTSTTKLPICELVSCPQIVQALANGTVSNNPNTVYSVQHFTCDVGFKLVGSLSTTCQLNGTWSSVPPTCSRITCDNLLSAPANGTLSIGPRTALSILEFSCNERYALQGSRSSLCQLDGTWSTGTPTCTRVMCSQVLSAPGNGTISTGPNTALSILEFSCNQGYTLQGSTYTLCQLNGAWSHGTPICNPITCNQVLSAPVNGAVSVGPRTALSVLDFSCNQGFTLQGSRSTLCQLDGTWSNSAPSCKVITCSQVVSPPANGAVSTGPGTALSVLDFSCNQGYTLQGSQTTICQLNGTWSSGTPTCKLITCNQVLSAPVNGAVSVGPRTALSVLDFSCNQGFTLQGSRSTVCQLDGTWSSGTPTCKLITCNQVLLAPVNGAISVGPRTALSVLDFSCNQGFTLQGSRSTICQLDGTWSSGTPTCKLVTCNQVLLAPVNGAVSVGSRTALSVLDFSCNQGFTLQGSRSTICQLDGSWSSGTPICKLITCNLVLLAPVNGAVTTGPGTALSVVDFSCNQGYILQGSRSAICQLDGTWSSATPSCKRITCDHVLPAPGNGTVSNGSRTAFSILYFSCNEGFNLQGSKSTLCQANGTWSSETPACNRIACSAVITPPENGMVLEGSILFGSIRGFSCNQGYELRGFHYARCQENGTWSASSPTCVQQEPSSAGSESQQLPTIAAGGIGFVIGSLMMGIVLVIMIKRLRQQEPKKTFRVTMPDTKTDELTLLESRMVTNAAYDTVRPTKRADEGEYEVMNPSM
ncbi:sushi, von Willebrand factor type A, EGF and pentraxin domain-containing protein 1-like isoform X2 [Sycon ciliatum]|uniref:sushi, von Willebrand factor type A, EGF and pentraxin domain-containing protein 1-like isoform X2 n=1 Tax=Sycon ciliatum TaxID=27933 RepID=UPI0031F61E3F